MFDPVAAIKEKWQRDNPPTAAEKYASALEAERKRLERLPENIRSMTQIREWQEPNGLSAYFGLLIASMEAQLDAAEKRLREGRPLLPSVLDDPECIAASVAADRQFQEWREARRGPPKPVPTIESVTKFFSMPHPKK